MAKGNFKLAWHSVGTNKWRSFLTMLGVVIGVTSVVTVLSLGEGVKKQLTAQIKQAGPDIITIRPGDLVQRDKTGHITDVNYLGLVSNGGLSESDLAIIQKVSDADMVVPFGLVNSVPKINGNSDGNLIVVATGEQLPSAFKQKIAYGSFFNQADAFAPAAVIGNNVAQHFFNQNAPIGQTLDLRGQEIIVRGVMAPFPASPLIPGVDYNNAIFIPYNFAKQVTGSSLQFYQILVKPKTGSQAKVVSDLDAQLSAAHSGAHDFTVLRAEDNLAIANKVLTVVTGLITAVAAISLIVGGIGIMNIMLVAVSERTREIGVRKSVGATNRQILNQFLLEAIVISGVGGVLGLIGSLIINYFLRLWTSLQPAISPTIMLGAILIAFLVGIVFGTAPALKAARLDPIEALRRP